jgi:hypothetical protein
MADSTPGLEPFHLMPKAADGRPRMVLRVGISGHRNLKKADPVELDRVLDQILGTIGDAVDTLHSDVAVQAVYSAAAPPILQFVSPLAEGADRIAAKAALRRKWRLATPMPFCRSNYEKDFPETVGEFETLLRNAAADGAVVELDGDYAEARRPEGYLEVGKFVLRHCDILIAIWDGNPAAGLGGTGDIVQHARELNIPVFHIHCMPPHAVSIWLEDAREQPLAPGGLRAMIDKQVQDILWPAIDPEALLMARRYFLHEAVKWRSDERDYYNDGPFVATPEPHVPGTKAVFRLLLRLAGGPFPELEQKPITPPPMPVNSRFLFDHFQRADCLATAYSHLHRSHFVLIYIFGALSLIASFAAITLHGSNIGALCLCGEFVLVWWMYLFFRFDRKGEWRDRWLDYRLLAEMLREADMLALVGRSLSYRTVTDHAEDLAPRARWVSLAFRAISRAAGVTGARYDKDHLKLVRAFAAEGRLTEQIRYHDKNAERAKSLNDRLKDISVVFFTLTLIAVTIEMVLMHPGERSLLEVLLALATGALPALAYGIFSIRNQAEFEIVGRRSERMKSRLRRHRKQLRDLDDPAFTSVALGRELVRASESMRHDVADWIGIFEMKEAETG